MMVSTPLSDERLSGLPLFSTWAMERAFTR